MLLLVLKRILLGFITLFIVSLITFSGVEVLPGDACTTYLEREAYGAALEACYERLGLNTPAHERYISWAAGVLQGDFGYSLSGEMGEELWKTLWQAGKKYNISPGCPNLIDRIEGGLMSYGNDFTSENNPLECNLDKYCKTEDDHDFIGKEALQKIQKNGAKQKIRGILFDGEPLTGIGQPLPVLSNENKKIGQITSGIYSPRIKKNIGLSMILKDYWEIGENIIVQMLNGEKKSGTITTLPFPQ